MIGKLVLKYKLIEWAIDTLFDKVTKNFTTFKFTLTTGQKFRKIIFNGNEFHECTIIKYNPTVSGFLLFSSLYMVRGKDAFLGFMGKDIQVVSGICNIPKPPIIIDTDIYILNMPIDQFEINKNHLEDYIYIQTGMFSGDPESIRDIIFVE